MGVMYGVLYVDCGLTWWLCVCVFNLYCTN